METLESAAADPYYNRYPVFDRQMALALLNKLDTGCIFYFQQYLKKYKGDINIKDCWQKMGLAYYINNNPAKANYCLEQARALGNTHTDADKLAYRFAENKVWPNKALLQARLLIEGGYYERALTILRSISPAQLSQPEDKLEYLFRYGRACQETGDNNKALDYYQKAINTGKDRHEQFAARAALQMGQIYEQGGMKIPALARYKECLHMPDHDFQNSIDQQAKAGLNRLGGND